MATNQTIRLLRDWDYEDAHSLTWDQQDALNQTNDEYDARGAYGIGSVAQVGAPLVTLGAPRLWERPFLTEATEVRPGPFADAATTAYPNVVVEAIQVVEAAEAALAMAALEAVQASAVATPLSFGAVATEAVMGTTASEVLLVLSGTDAIHSSDVFEDELGSGGATDERALVAGP